MGESPAETGGWERTAKDLFAGAAGGIAQVLLGESSVDPALSSGLMRGLKVPLELRMLHMLCCES